MPSFALIICFLEFGVTLAIGIRQIYNQIDKILFPENVYPFHISLEEYKLPVMSVQ